MRRRLRARTIWTAASLAAHAALAAALWSTPGERPAARAYELEIDVVEVMKPQPEQEVEVEQELPEEPAVAEAPEPPPPPRPKPRAAPEPPAPKPAAEAPAPALQTGIELDSPAADPASEVAERPSPAPLPAPRPAAPRPREKKAPRGAASAACDEPPTKPKPIERPRDIEYVDDARARGVEGRLVLAVRVAADGMVAEVSVASPVDPVLDAAAVEAVESWRFEPARRCGEAVEGTYKLARRFVLGD